MWVRIPHDDGLIINLRNVTAVLCREQSVYIYTGVDGPPFKVTADEWRRASKTPAEDILGIRTANPTARPADELEGADFALLEG